LKALEFDGWKEGKECKVLSLARRWGPMVGPIIEKLQAEETKRHGDECISERSSTRE
jgi:hypothetical protein